MIISASRRTDIPAYYSDWFFNRVKEGFVLVRNPMNYKQISQISLKPDVVDGIVFWTKNPMPMLKRLDELKDYTYYFQFTITPYEEDIEPNLQYSKDLEKNLQCDRDFDRNTEFHLDLKKGQAIETFKYLADTIGADRVIWRYDPILLNEKYSAEYHIQAFEKIAKALHNYTRKVTISFIDEEYRNVKSNLKKLALLNFPVETRIEISSELAKVAHKYGLAIDTCAESIDLQKYGIQQARCIDDKLFEKLRSCSLNTSKDKTQRPECGCITSIDIGMYNTCKNGCLYCYANYNKTAIDGNCANHNPLAPLISGEVTSDDKISVRSVKSCMDMQFAFNIRG